MAPRLETARLILRPFAPGDWDALNAMLSDATATRYMHFSTWTDDQRRRWFEWCLANDAQPGADAVNWAITRRDSDETIGWFGIGGAAQPDVPGERSFGFLLAPAHWNRGFMTEALRAVMDHELQTRATPRLRATCEVANAASARVLEKVGFRREKTVRDADFEGNVAERHHYAISRDEYEVTG